MSERLNVEKLLGRFSEYQRLVAIAAIPLVALVVFFGIAVNNQLDKRRDASNVNDIVEYSERAGALLQELQAERALLALSISQPGEVSQQQLDQQYAATDTAIQRFVSFAEDHQSVFGSSGEELVAHLIEDVTADEIPGVRAAAASGTLTIDQLMSEYEDTTSEILESVALAPRSVDDAQIAGHLDAYLNLLEAGEGMSRTRALLIDVFARDEFAPGQAAQLQAQVVNMEDDLAEFQRGAHPSVARLAAEIANNPAVNDTNAAIQTALNSDSRFGVNPLGWYDVTGQSAAVYAQLRAAEASALIDDADEIAASAASSLTLLIIGFLLALAISAALVYLVARSIVRPLADLTRVSEEIQAGNFAARAEVDAGHATGSAAAALNQALDELTGLVQTREERDRIQSQIITLLDEVSAVAEGDLTVEAEVTADALGSVADSFNYMISELRGIVANVNQTTAEVTQASGDIARTSSTLAELTERQSQQIAEAAVAIEEMAISIGQVSENAALGASVAADARRNAQRGAESVRATIEGMQRIRQEVQGTSRSIKRLGESSQEIGTIVALIEEIANQTNLLALNAAIQAAMAGEHGRGFAVVAEEVRRLAERASEATQQIGALVTSIQQETSEAVMSMDNSTREVVEGSRLADEAGATLAEIDAVVSRMSELIEGISVSADAQATTASQVAATMKEISESTHTTTASTREAAESVSRLAGLAERLRESVATFRIGGEDSMPAMAPSPADGD